MMPLPLVTVVVPLYNKRETVARTLRSIKAQTLNNLECIVVNNNSRDEPDAVVLAEIKDDGRFSYVNCAEQGVAHARNFGIARAQGLYICCLDADDEIAPIYLEKCVAALQDDNSLAIAYSGLTAVNPDGSRFLSEWPGKFDYDLFIVKQNQVHTAAVFRRAFWERAGGYRQRFAPGGAGAEDAEFFLRIGALGGRGLKVSAEGLFIYHLGGQVSGDPDYEEPDWLAGKPWLQDGRHPFASLATPADGEAHPVRSYDRPLVSIVIPCGPGHGRYLADCLDSIEAQSCRQWEVVLVADVDDAELGEITRLLRGFPFVRLIVTTKPGSGAGVARNRGAEAARAPLLLFLDADDWLAPNALNILLAGYAENPMTVIYGDYIGHAYIQDRAELTRLQQHKRLLAYDENSGEATVLYHSLEYDCEKARQQPDLRRPYIWNVVTSLLPKAFHEEIGGFDEQMESWEDWDYWLRLARHNKCFTRVTEPIMEYRFYSGARRALANPIENGEDGRQLSGRLLEYMQGKYREDGTMACKSCGGGKRRTTPVPQPMMAMSLNEGEVYSMASDDFVWVELQDGNIGSHRIVFQRENYGYRSSGERFKMRLAHAKADNRVRIVEEEMRAAAERASSPAATALEIPPATRKPLPKLEPAKAEVPVLDEAADSEDDEDDALIALVYNQEDEDAEVAAEEEAARDAAAAVTGEAPISDEENLVRPKPIYDFTAVWGIGRERHETLVERGVRSLSGLIAMDVAGIKKILDVPEKTAERILQAAKELSSE